MMGIGMPISQASAPFMGVLLMVDCRNNAGSGGPVPCRQFTVESLEVEPFQWLASGGRAASGLPA